MKKVEGSGRRALISSRRARWAAGALLLTPVLLVSSALAGGKRHGDSDYVESGDHATAEIPVNLVSAFTSRSRECPTISVIGISFPGFTRSQPIPNTSLTFHQGGREAESVLVHFEASFPRPQDVEVPSGSMRSGIKIALLIDGQRVDVIGDHGDYKIPELELAGDTTSTDGAGTHGFSFVTRPIAPGDHTVTVVWSPVQIGMQNTMCIAGRTLTVQHH